MRFRRIKLKAGNSEGKQEVLTIASSAVMPAMTGLTDEIEKALFLRQFAVPFWALTRVFCREDKLRLTLLSRPRVDENKVIDIRVSAVVVAAVVAVEMW